jgi:esterase/lipase superfamily enzyme
VNTEFGLGQNRRPIDIGDVTKGFSGERDTRTHFGWCRIFIPKSHRIGSIGSWWWKRVRTGTDDRLRLLDITTADEDSFWLRIHDASVTGSRDENEAVVFVHGYNVSFEEAALRAAQIGCDLSIRGVMAFFSWPSKGTLAGYFADAATIEASEPVLKEFLMRIAAMAGVEKVHVIAHSMGNRGVLRAISRVTAEVKKATGKTFAQFILAAPDIDSETFGNLADCYRKLGKRTTLYVSSRDLAVEVSSWVHDFHRVGFAPPVTVLEGIDTISVANIDLTLLGHGYVANARAVLEDMHQLIKLRVAPNKRFGLRRALSPEGKTYWEILS